MVILTCRIALVSYYLYKVFVIIETKKVGLYKVPIRVKNQINAVSKNDENSILPYIQNGNSLYFKHILKKLHSQSCLWRLCYKILGLPSYWNLQPEV